MGKLNISNMKKTVTIIFVILYSLSYGQDQANKKFEFGISYSLTSKEDIFNNPFNSYVNYKIKDLDNLDLNVGLRLFYFGSKESANFSNRLGFNPNISTSYFFAKNKFNTYASLGYYFDSFETSATIIGVVTSPKRNIKTNGMTITPGLKYFIHSNIFIDTNLTFLVAKTEDDFYKSEIGNNIFFNVGLGVTF